MKQIAILGSTGSIGQSTLSVIESYPDRYAVASLAAGQNLDAAFEQCRKWRPRVVSMATAELAGKLEIRLREAGISGIEGRRALKLADCGMRRRGNRRGKENRAYKRAVATNGA